MNEGRKEEKMGDECEMYELVRLSPLFILQSRRIVTTKNPSEKTILTGDVANCGKCRQWTSKVGGSDD